MQSGWVRSNKRILVIIVIAVLGLVPLLLGLWVRAAYRETQVAANLTPELIVRAFQDAGVETNDVQDMDYYPGPMSSGERGISFTTHANDGETFAVLVVMYTNIKEARQAMVVVNEMNQRMNGTYGYAFYRGPITLVVGTYDEGVARVQCGVENDRVAG